MELNTILELVKAGFTKDEIMQMEKPQPIDPNPAPTVKPVATPVPVAEPTNPPTQVVEPVAPAVPEQVVEPVAVPAPTHQPVQTPAQGEPTMADVMQGIAKLTSAIQANAIAQSVIPKVLQNQPSAEDTLAEIIRPTFKERN